NDLTDNTDGIVLDQHRNHRPFLLKGELNTPETFFAMSSSIVSRPPGTGKTSTLAPLALLQATQKHLSVLILSHTNIAVDNAVMRLKEFYLETGNDHLLPEHKLVRFGDPRHPDLLTEAYRDI